ncbi:MAG: dTDP-4-dehydrorhamnose reductase [Pseudomonadota bacterium]
MRILVIGSSGQVAKAFSEVDIPLRHRVINIARPSIDLSDEESIFAALSRETPDIVVNAGAYTNVDAAENDETVAFRINAEGPGFLAKASAMQNIPLIHLSTDYVFDGEKKAPYTEDDRPSPLGVYGRSKLQGEKAVLTFNKKSLILRTAWVYSPFGKNFLKTMLRLAETRDDLNVVHDQRGSPTYAIHIAEAILKLVPLLINDEAAFGVYHLAGSGDTTWAEFAEEIFRISAKFGGPTARVKKIATTEYRTPAQRPKNSRLDCSKIKKDFDVEMPDWKHGVQHCVERLIKQAQTE